MAIERITAEWNGFPGGPGYSNFYFGGPTGDPVTGAAQAQRVSDFFTAMRTYIPQVVKISIVPTAVTIDETSGQMTGMTSIEVPPPVAGGAAQPYPGPAGAVVNWMTSSFVNGRLLRGKTFIVPLVSTAFDSSGTLSTSARGAISDAANGLLEDSATGFMQVWSRPRGGAGGTSADITSAVVPDFAAVLRSRRD